MSFKSEIHRFFIKNRTYSFIIGKLLAILCDFYVKTFL